MKFVYVFILSLLPALVLSDYQRGTELYERGQVEEAIQEFRAGTNENEALSQFALGTYYYFGEGVPQDYVLARELFEKAAEQGENQSAYFLGLIYRDGLGVDPTPFKAVKHFRVAAEACIPRAQTMLAAHYFEGNGIEKSNLMAGAWILIAAWMGDEQANAGIKVIIPELKNDEGGKALLLQKELIAKHGCETGRT